MALSCGSQCAKIILFVFNFLFWLAGAALLGVGIWFLVDHKALQVLHVVSVDTSDELVRAAAYTFVAVGSVVFVAGFLGCCGAVKESSCMLITYAVILGFLLVLEIAAGILAVVYRNDIQDSLDKSMNKTVFDYYGQAGHEASTTAWDFTQVEFKCCGATVGPADWVQSKWAANNTGVPLTCCVLNNTDSAKPDPMDKSNCLKYASDTSNANAKKYVHVHGCRHELNEWIKDHSGILIATAFAVAAVQIIAMILACCLRTTIKAGYESV